MAWLIRFALVNGKAPVQEWLDSLTGKDLPKQLAALAGIERVLAVKGTDVCETEWGKNFGKGLYEFRIRRDAETIKNMFPLPEDELDQSPAGTKGQPILLRIFFTTAGRQVILLASAYDKGEDSSERRQQEEIARARAILRALKKPNV